MAAFTERDQMSPNLCGETHMALRSAIKICHIMMNSLIFLDTQVNFTLKLHWGEYLP